MPEKAQTSVEQVDKPIEEKVLKETIHSSCRVESGDTLSKVFKKLGITESYTSLSRQAEGTFGIIHAGSMFSRLTRTVSTGVATQTKEIIVSKGKEYVLSQTNPEYTIPKEAFINVGEKKITTSFGLLNRLHESYPSLVKNNPYNYGKDITRNIPGDFKEGDMAWCQKEGESVVLYYLSKGKKVPQKLYLEGRTNEKIADR